MDSNSGNTKLIAACILVTTVVVGVSIYRAKTNRQEEQRRNKTRLLLTAMILLLCGLSIVVLTAGNKIDGADAVIFAIILLAYTCFNFFPDNAPEFLRKFLVCRGKKKE